MDLINVRMQWDLPFIHHLDLNLIEYCFQVFNGAFTSGLIALYEFKPIKFLPFVIAFCWIWVKYSDEKHRKMVIEAVFNGLLALIITRIFSFTLPYRARPKNTPEFNHDVVNIPVDGWSSFPSDHAVFAMSMSFSLYRINPIIGLLFAMHSVVVICFPRVVLGLHYPSDLFFGGLLGLLITYASIKSKLSHLIAESVFTAYIKYPSYFYFASFVILFEFVDMFEVSRIILMKIYHFLKHFI